MARKSFKNSFMIYKIDLLLIALLVCYTTSSLAQKSLVPTIIKKTSVTDSLGYMDELVANKQKYINQSLSILLNDIKIPVMSYSTSVGIVSNNIHLNTAIQIYFDDSFDSLPQQWNNQARNAIAIIIEWATPLKKYDMDVYLSGRGGWTTSEQKYFKNEIVKDIVMPFRK